MLHLKQTSWLAGVDTLANLVEQGVAGRATLFIANVASKNRGPNGSCVSQFAWLALCLYYGRGAPLAREGRREGPWGGMISALATGNHMFKVDSAISG